MPLPLKQEPLAPVQSVITMMEHSVGNRPMHDNRQGLTPRTWRCEEDLVPIRSAIGVHTVGPEVRSLEFLEEQYLPKKVVLETTTKLVNLAPVDARYIP